MRISIYPRKRKQRKNRSVPVKKALKVDQQKGGTQNKTESFTDQLIKPSILSSFYCSLLSGVTRCSYTPTIKALHNFSRNEAGATYTVTIIYKGRGGGTGPRSIYL